MTIHPNELQYGNDNVQDLIEWLASFGKTKNEGVTRLLYSKAWGHAQQALKEKMEQFGLNTYFDCVGNLYGKLQGTDTESPVILTGSHVDSVVEGGKYDGAYGIIASMIAVSRLAETYGSPKKSIEVVSFCEEEGSRFPLAFWGSRNTIGAYSLDDVKELKDADGISFFQAMKQNGFDPANYQSPCRNDIERFLEIHIEQGMVLEKNKKSIGVVTDIVGQRRYQVEIKGESNHAGTTPMLYRKDAMVTASQLIALLTVKAKEMDPDLVATVGRVDVAPNVPNVVAGDVEFSLDIRHHKEEVLNQFTETLFKEFKNKAEELETTIEVSQWMDVKPVSMDRELVKDISMVAEKNNLPFQEIISGAGHDAQIFASKIPTNLIFVPSQGGISHNPKEFTSVKELEMGIDLLTQVLYKLAY
ncbi:allantoate deiminase [Mesobacillus maritimus]|uniref:Allantoate deiminase n=1 Tax=Mesobacillus maritimus TaxID=1643336 RepID=A0ABS7K0H9_9BACI|nr:allantoate deiminase [Mesobacillus maritimus]MBY0095758.1 allantoate deiminase [Mesobacillus maritimus]